MTNQELFLETLNDLRQKTKGSYYEHLRACGLLRHLLLDKPSLLELVNKNIKHKVTFHVSDFLSKPPFGRYIDFSILEPITKQTHLIKLGAFLSIRFLKYDCFEYSVKDVIRAVAHKFGGVHSSEENDEKDNILKKIDELIRKLTKLQLDVLYQSINSISVVAIKAMEPIESIIKEQ